MDFFEAQAHAKKRTRRLVVLFALAVLGTILASYAAAILIFWQISPRARHFHDSYRAYTHTGDWPDDPHSYPWWDRNIFLCTAAGVVVVVGAGSFYKWSQLHSGGGAAIAESVGGRRIDSGTADPGERRLLNVVEEMAIASGVPMPTVYVLNDEVGINAFAAGLTTHDAVVTVTSGALDKLSRDELQGVIGHEFSHILNGDMRLNLKLAAIIFGILVIGLTGHGILRGMFNSRVRVGRKGGGGIALVLAVGVALMIIGYVGYFFGRLIQAAVSRQREFLADASSVQFTRNPDGIGGALKKIGGYALGSVVENHSATEIGHFFFAQAFSTSFTGLWATHPPLTARIRAIDAQWDGKFFEPPEKVDIAHETFKQILHPLTAQPAGRPAPSAASNPLSAIAAIGTLTTGGIASAQSVLGALPPALLAAARDAHQAPVLIYGLLLDSDATVAAQQRQIIAARAGSDALQGLDSLRPAVAGLAVPQRLPLVQLTLAPLRQLPPAALAPFLETLDQLVHVDGRVDTFGFGLQKMLRRSLATAHQPAGPGEQIFSFEAVAREISVVLSALAHVSSNVDMDARAAFTAGAGQLRILEGKLTLLEPAEFTPGGLDGALDRLADASFPIKQRLVTAAAHVVGADGVILDAEAELLRTICAALDVPMPPLAPAG
ncbi:MAG TPA: M48 family metallopeptidase [Opitutaceae bacterium]|nr:M48 family metallopeptidase [Opitutaceae bacterium]